jgi:hypothetical protein
MGGFGIWHWVIVLTTLACTFFAVIAATIWIVARVVRRPAAPSSIAASLFPAPLSGSTEARLLELASLRSRGLITDGEYEQRRSDILSHT